MSNSNIMGINKIIEKLFNEKINDPYSFYQKVILEIEKEDPHKINKIIKEKIATFPLESSINRLLIIGSVLYKTGTPLEEIITFFSRNIKQKISINQFNFAVFAFYNSSPPLNSDILFDLTEYTYLDNKIIERRIKEISKKIKPITDIRIIFFLFLLFLRNDLQNENLKLIIEVLFNVSSKLKNKLKENKLIQSFHTITKTPSHPRKKKLASEKKKTSEPALQEKPEKVSKTVNELKKEKPANTEAKKLAETPKIESSGSKKIILKPLYIFISIFIIIIIAILSLLFTHHKNPNIPEEKIEEITKKEKAPSPEQSLPIQKKETQKVEIPETEPPIKYYTVKKGDTLSGISKKFYGRGYLYRELADINKIKNPDIIYPGENLKIPGDINKKNNNNN